MVNLKLINGSKCEIKGECPLGGVVTVIISSIIASLILVNKIMDQELSQSEILLSLLCVFHINFVIMRLGILVAEITKEKSHTDDAINQKEYYVRQLSLLYQNYDEIKMFRHDMKNRMIALQEMALNNDCKRIVDYTGSLFGILEKNNIYSNTGNISVDSIINYKFNEAEKRKIRVDAKMAIPENIAVDDDDMIVILGNLLDNATEAADMVEGNKYIRLDMEYDRDIIYIKIDNSYSTPLKMKDKILQTTKVNRQMHGIGLNSTKLKLRKYNGAMDISYDDNEFSTRVVLHVNKD